MFWREGFGHLVSLPRGSVSVSFDTTPKQNIIESGPEEKREATTSLPYHSEKEDLAVRIRILLLTFHNVSFSRVGDRWLDGRKHL